MAQQQQGESNEAFWGAATQQQHRVFLLRGRKRAEPGNQESVATWCNRANAHILVPAWQRSVFHFRQRQKWQDAVGLIWSDITLNSKAGSHLETFIGGALSLGFLEHSGPPPSVGARNHSPTRPSLHRAGSEKSRGPT